MEGGPLPPPGLAAGLVVGAGGPGAPGGQLAVVVAAGHGAGLALCRDWSRGEAGGEVQPLETRPAAADRPGPQSLPTGHALWQGAVGPVSSPPGRLPAAPRQQRTRPDLAGVGTLLASVTVRHQDHSLSPLDLHQELPALAGARLAEVRTPGPVRPATHLAVPGAGHRAAPPLADRLELGAPPVRHSPAPSVLTVDLPGLEPLPALVARRQLAVLPVRGPPAVPVTAGLVRTGLHLQQGVGRGAALALGSGQGQDGPVPLPEGQAGPVGPGAAHRGRAGGPGGPRGDDTVLRAGDVAGDGGPGSDHTGTQRAAVGRALKER